MTDVLPATEQPISTEIKMLDGIFVKSMVTKRAGTLIPQHSHAFDHVTVLVRGHVHVQVDDRFLGIYRAPAGIIIKAGQKHLFTTLTNDTLMLCVHDIGTAEGVEILEEHQLAPGASER
jgi:quercetin dioxygenase-like cupin family protein